MRPYLYIWFILTLLLGYEFWALNYNGPLSLFLWAQGKGLIAADVKLNTIPGRSISLWLGWVGFSLMVLMNVYSMRKRFSFMQNLGRLSHWLNFHIFCGIMGPTLIFFHCGLKVRGLVGISFWSMVISLTSGIIGRYFFVQLSSHKGEFEAAANKALEKLNKILEKVKIEIAPEKKEKLLKISLAHVGANLSDQQPGPFSAFLSSIEGDFRIAFSDLPMPKNWPLSAKAQVLRFAINKRRSQSIGSFEKLMGYWHSFHFPFAIFMYVAAVIHIISSLVFLSPG